MTEWVDMLLFSYDIFRTVSFEIHQLVFLWEDVSMHDRGLFCPLQYDLIYSISFWFCRIMAQFEEGLFSKGVYNLSTCLVARYRRPRLLPATPLWQGPRCRGHFSVDHQEESHSPPSASQGLVLVLNQQYPAFLQGSNIFILVCFWVQTVPIPKSYYSYLYRYAS